MTSTAIVNKVWNFCHTLRDDGVGYGDYLEQLTYLLFLKMADEYSKPPYNRDTKVPRGFNWQSLRGKSGAELESHYVKLLDELGKKTGMLGDIFVKAQNKISDPAKLHKLINLIDSEDWVVLGADVKGDIYEGLLQKNAEDTKSGAGQYFTPRALIQAMVECVRPLPQKTIADPACGTGGFFLAAYDYLNKEHKLNKDQLKHLKYETFHGWEIVTSTARLCLMNLFLHNVGDMDHEADITRDDSLRTTPTKKFDYVLTNPPFGKKSSTTVTNEAGEEKREALTYNRQDFWATTSNKQLNFVQHICSILKPGGSAAVVLPDNVLFEGGAGETVRKQLLKTTELHTILRLPTGLFYAQGVKANVLFFENKPGAKTPWTKDVWIYDYRTNIKHTLKTDPLQFEDLADFIKCYNPADRHKRKATWTDKSPEGRWRKYTYDEIVARDKASLDIFWLKDDSLEDSANLPEPGVLAAEIVHDLEAALKELQSDSFGLEDVAMAQFLTTADTSAAIERIIRDARHSLTLISAFVYPRIIHVQRLHEAGERGVRIDFVFGKQPMDKGVFADLRALPNMRLLFLRELHAKCYFNERQAVITSLNLLNSSEAKNREMGILLDHQADADSFHEMCKEAQSIIRVCELIHSTIPERQLLSEQEDWKKKVARLGSEEEVRPAEISDIDKIRRTHPRAYLRWSHEEDTVILEMLEKGLARLAISEVLQRQPSAISARIMKLRGEEGASAS